MNDVIKGLEKIKNTIVGGLFLSLTIVGIGLINLLINDISVKIISLVLYLILFIGAILLLYQIFSGFGLIRRANLINKLNQRIDEWKIYMVSAFLLCFLYIVLVLLGSLLLVLPLIYVALIVLLIGLVLMVIAGYRTVQILGILGVYADNADLKNKAVSMLFLFKIQIANVILTNVASFFKGYLDIGYYFILIPSALYSLYIFVMWLSLFNLSIDVYKRIERDYV